MRRLIKYTNVKVIGLTGGIGSGQTTTAKLFKKHGCKVIELDKSAREIVSKDPVVKSELTKTFGKNIYFNNGRVNAKLLAKIVFSDSSKTQILNRIVHPRMVEKVVEEIETARFSGKYPLVIIDAALIYEISIEKIFDYIVVVFCDLKQRQKRVKARDDMTVEEFTNRMNQQIPLDDKRKWADFVIDNKGDFDNLEKQVQNVYSKLQKEVKKQKIIRV